MGCSDRLVSCLNFVTAAVAIPILGAGIWLATREITNCYTFLQWPVIFIGAFIFLTSLAGFVGSNYRIVWLFWLYLALMLLLIMLLLCFTVFSFMVAVEGRGEDSGSSASWLKAQLEDSSNWSNIKRCLIEANVCGGIETRGGNLSWIEEGCCTDPGSCETFASSTADCKRFNGTDARVMCFDCEDCRDGVLNSIQMRWRYIAIVNLICLVLLILIYSVGCCAMRNIKKLATGESSDNTSTSSDIEIHTA